MNKKITTPDYLAKENILLYNASGIPQNGVMIGVDIKNNSITSKVLKSLFNNSKGDVN